MNIYQLESEIFQLKHQLKIKENQLSNLKLSHIKDELFNDFQELLSRDEMELIYQLLFAYFLTKEYNYEFYNKYLNKTAELLDLWPNQILKKFKPLLELYKNYEELLEDEEITEKLNLFSCNIDLLEEDDTEHMMEVFC